MTIKAIVFDLFGVIYKDRWKEFLYDNRENLTNFLLESSDIPFAKVFDPPITYPNYYNQLINLNTNSSNIVSDEAFYSVLSKASKLNAEIIYSMIHDKSVLNKEVSLLIERLKSMKYLIGMITNGNMKITQEFLNDFEIKNLFDQVITSEEAKIAKPNPLIYKLMKETLNTKYSEMIFIDDSKVNTEAAKNLGIYTIDYINQNQRQLYEEINSIIISHSRKYK